MAGTHNLFARPVTRPGSTRELSKEPDFPAYLDNIGVFGFAREDVLCFFGGDNFLSSVVPDEEIGAADMYANDFGENWSSTLTNVTRTNGAVSPPFAEPASLRFSEAFVGPRAKRILLYGESADDGGELSIFQIDGGVGVGPNHRVLLSALTDIPRFADVTAGLLVLAHRTGAGGVPSAEVHLLRGDAADPLAQELVRLSPTGRAWTPGTRLDRLVVGGGGRHAAFVATTPEGATDVYRIDGASGALSWVYEGHQLSRTLAFDGDGGIALCADRESPEFVLLARPGEAPRRFRLAGPGRPLAD